jgi:protein tyrosine phosphatase (PTP) superfamily phosphohydrolase (DUF442 family)
VFDATRKLLVEAERPILVHCASANRTGAIWLVFRVLDTGLEYDAALAEAKQSGLRSAAFEAKAKGYIDRAQRKMRAPR